jgi:hypothetical protein
MAEKADPYRLATPAGHRNGQWFKEMVDRFVPEWKVIHLRGLHYCIVSANDVFRPDNGKLYVNDDTFFEWLCEYAAKAGRWLDYVPWERINDERNAAPELVLKLFMPMYSINTNVTKSTHHDRSQRHLYRKCLHRSKQISRPCNPTHLMKP